MTAFDVIDRRALEGAFDVIGDVHGCIDELHELLARLGYRVKLNDTSGTAPDAVSVVPPANRRLVFVGDFVDRGPGSPEVLRLVMNVCRSGAGLAVPGNHDDKFLRHLKGHNVRLTHGLDGTIEQMRAHGAAFHDEVRAFLDLLPLHLWLDGGRLAVAHAGIRQSMLGRTDYNTRSFCLYGDTEGQLDEDGLPIRYNWAAEHRGETFIVYGHTPVPEPAWQNQSVCIDTGCCYGGALTALRWPERETVSVPASRAHAPLRRPMALPPQRPK